MIAVHSPKVQHMKALATIFLSLLYGAAVAQDKIEDHYKIYDTRTKQVIPVDKIIEDCQTAHVLFFGEEHNDSVCHWLEQQIFSALHQRYGNGLALSLEMFETDNQTALNDYLAGFIPEDRFAKDVRLWSNYKDYRPMIEYARQNNIPVIAADPPRRYVNLVSRRGMHSL